MWFITLDIPKTVFKVLWYFHFTCCISLNFLQNFFILHRMFPWIGLIVRSQKKLGVTGLDFSMKNPAIFSHLCQKCMEMRWKHKNQGQSCIISDEPNSVTPNFFWLFAFKDDQRSIRGSIKNFCRKFLILFQIECQKQSFFCIFPQFQSM